MRKVAPTGNGNAATPIQLSSQEAKNLVVKELVTELTANSEGHSKDLVPPLPGKKTELTRRDYGIEEAIRLMRRMPDSDMRILAKVIKECLESTNIRIANIIKDAEVKEARLEEQIKKLDSEIEDLESMIQQRKNAIQSLVQDLEETRQVKNNLALAEGSHDLEIEPAKAKANKSKAKFEDSEERQQREKSTALLLDSLFGEQKKADKEGEASELTGNSQSQT